MLHISNIKQFIISSDVIVNISLKQKTSMDTVHRIPWRHQPLCAALPKTVVSRLCAEQFQRCALNCHWHSLTPNLAPLTTLCMASGWARHSRRWPVSRPGILSHIGGPTSPSACTGSWLNDLTRQCQGHYVQVNQQLLFNAFAFILLFLV